jgi:hypothetical protein
LLSRSEKHPEGQAGLQPMKKCLPKTKAAKPDLSVLLSADLKQSIEGRNVR